MQGFNVCDYEVRLFGATVTQCFDVMDAMKPIVSKLKPLQQPLLSQIRSILECHSGDGSLFTWQILQGR